MVCFLLFSVLYLGLKCRLFQAMQCLRPPASDVYARHELAIANLAALQAAASSCTSLNRWAWCWWTGTQVSKGREMQGREVDRLALQALSSPVDRTIPPLHFPPCLLHGLVPPCAVTVAPGDIMLSFGAFPAEIPARCRLLHPLHNFALVSYDPRQLSEEVRCARCAAL